MKGRRQPLLFGGLRHVKTLICFALMQLPQPHTWRYRFARLGGVNFRCTDNGHKCYFIADHVRFDSVYPRNITIYNDVHITRGVTFLTHRLDTRNPDLSDIHWKENRITIMPRAFIGTNAIICADATIGEGAIIGAGSVVTKDVPPYEIWAGNPARFIRKRGL